MDENKRLTDDLVHLARLSLTGRRQDVLLFLRRVAKKYAAKFPETASELGSLIREMPSSSSPLRSQKFSSIPVDSDSRLQLLRLDNTSELALSPIWMDQVKRKLDQIILERTREAELYKAGLSPSRTVLFTGAPGVGKSLAAKWIAQQLHLPLLVLDLSAVMSSFLGRTGTNLRQVLDYAKSTQCILLLDELDAIAKRRDDVAEVGELKRLVTVMLQEIDDWPSSGLLIAATNHPKLLDPAIWRRFDMAVEFPMPDGAGVSKLISKLLPDKELTPESKTLLEAVLSGKSFSDIERALSSIKRNSVLRNGLVKESISEYLLQQIGEMNKQEKIALAQLLVASGFSQRSASEFTGVSRDTIRKGGETSKAVSNQD